MRFGLLQKPRVVVAILAIYVLSLLAFLSAAMSNIPWVDYATLTFRGLHLVATFIAGILAYLYKEHIKYSKYGFYACISLCTIVAIACDNPGESPTMASVLIVLLTPAFAYMTAFIGLTKIKIPKFFKNGDYSYGIYLYHLPMLQVVVYFIYPNNVSPIWLALSTMLLGGGLTMIDAYLSWHCVERPILKLRKNFSFMARSRGVA